MAVLEAFLAEGVDTVFGYPGGAIMPIYDALYDYKEKLKHILVRHEQGAIHAAQGFARVSHRAGICPFIRHGCLPGNRCYQYHYTGYQMELPGDRCQ